MKKPRRVLLVIGFVLAIAVILLFWAGRGRNSDQVSLIFVAFTNQPMPVAPYAGMSPDGQSWMALYPISVPAALLVVTNRGSVEAEVASSLMWPESLVASDFINPPPIAPPSVLKPGGSMTLSLMITPDKRVWRTELAYRRHGWREKLWDRAWNSGNSTVQELIAPLYTDFRRAKCGPIVNPSPLRTWPRIHDQSSDLPEMFLPVSETIVPFLEFRVPRPSVNPSWEDLQRSSPKFD